MPLEFVDRITRETAGHRSGLPQFVFGLNSGLSDVGLGFCLFAACLLGCGSASGQTWVTNGPYGGLITALAVDPKTPTTIYAGSTNFHGSGAGIFKSVNGGRNWTAINNGLSSGLNLDLFDGVGLSGNLAIAALAIDPVTPTTLYAGTLQGLFKSTDAGGSWSFIDPMVPLNGGSQAVGQISALAIDPTTPTTLYAASSSAGLFKSTDGGASWTATNNGLPGTVSQVVALAINPVTPTTLYAVMGLVAGSVNGCGTVNGTCQDVFKSTDGGGSWGPASAGLPAVINVLALAIDPVTPTTLYAAAKLVGSSWLGVFKSTDGGGSWSTINTGFADLDIQSVAVDPGTPTTLYAGDAFGPIYKRTNGGETGAPSQAPTATANL